MNAVIDESGNTKIGLRIVVLKTGCEIPFNGAMDKTLDTRTGRLTLFVEKEAIYAEHPAYAARYGGAKGVWVPIENCALWVEGDPMPKEAPKPPEPPKEEPKSLLKDDGSVKFVKDPKTGQTGIKKADGSIELVAAKI